MPEGRDISEILMTANKAVPLDVGGKTLQVRLSYNCCAICGYTPKGGSEPNYTPIRFWDPDDGWKTGTLCRHCANEAVVRTPQPTDYAYHDSENVQ